MLQRLMNYASCFLTSVSRTHSAAYCKYKMFKFMFSYSANYILPEFKLVRVHSLHGNGNNWIPQRDIQTINISIALPSLAVSQSKHETQPSQSALKITDKPVLLMNQLKLQS